MNNQRKHGGNIYTTINFDHSFKKNKKSDNQLRLKQLIEV